MYLYHLGNIPTHKQIKKKKYTRSIDVNRHIETFNLPGVVGFEKIREIIRHYRESPIRDERQRITTPPLIYSTGHEGMRLSWLR